MTKRGWKQLLSDKPWFRGRGNYPITAYSEFMPPPRLGRKPNGEVDALLFSPDDPWGWHITEYEQAFEIEPGWRHLARNLLTPLRHLGRGEPAHGIAKNKLEGNPCWPRELQLSGSQDHERYVVLLPFALSRTQDDKGRVRWTVLGGSEQGPARAFWRGFYSSPTQEMPADWAMQFFRRLLAAAYGESLDDLADLHRAGLRIFPTAADPDFPSWSEEPLPHWTKPLLWEKGQSLGRVKYLLTFTPYARLPAAVRKAYQAGKLHLLPFPGSLLFWGVQSYRALAKDLPFALQIPLLTLLERFESPHGLRVPQSGWLHEPHPNHPHASEHFGPLRNKMVRTNRWARIHRQDDELAVDAHEDKVAHVLFSSAANDIGLYGKPMARNAQIWTTSAELLLDGPRATREELKHAAQRLAEGGMFGYRFYFPPMRVDRHELVWHRPLVAYLSPETGEPTVLPDAPLGYLTAYNAEKPRLDKAVELWPRLLRRGVHHTAVEIFDRDHDQRYHRTTTNVRKLLDAARQSEGRPLEPEFARQLLTLPKDETLDDWLTSLPRRTAHSTAGMLLADALRSQIAAPAPAKKSKPTSLTFARTGRRAFEEQYWRTIADLATGKFKNKDNADCVLDAATRSRLTHDQRDLEALGDYLLNYYTRTIAAKKLVGKALAGDLPFQWRTDFDFHWMGGWARNQEGLAEERNLMVVIPGRDRRRAVIMADHYDTAYMEDEYGYAHGGGGPRLAACGADDNHSATAALMLAAPVLMDLSRAGKLGCDVWLVHLTGEEFPSDCLGARHLCQSIVEGNLHLRLPSGRQHDLSRTRVQGVYVLDMIAHNIDRDRDVFQIAPGASKESLWLAYQAHRANRVWNELAAVWNQSPPRRNCARGQRSADGATMPQVALHPHLSGEVRPVSDPRSTLFNTDGQIFSDAGVPVVLFMENYDINRQGYHDTHDTLENIDLDYGAAVAAIAIESVARAATEQRSN